MALFSFFLLLVMIHGVVLIFEPLTFLLCYHYIVIIIVAFIGPQLQEELF